MDRRQFLNSIAFGLLAAPLTIRAQQRKVWRIGLLREGIHAIEYPFWDAMYGLGWIEGRNVIVEARYAATPDELPLLAAELVALNVDVIMTGGPPATLAAQQATKTIPIVFWMSGDPVAYGVVTSLARPGANVTGFSYLQYRGKMLGALKDALPGAVRITVPVNPPHPELVDVARNLGVEITGIEVNRPQDFATFFASARRLRADAVLIPDAKTWFSSNWPLIAEEAKKSRMPTIGPYRWFVEAGGLMSYGPAPQHFKTLAPVIDKIFRGVKPTDIPVQLPTKFEMYINLKTAEALGITIPKSVQARADEILR